MTVVPFRPGGSVAIPSDVDSCSPHGCGDLPATTPGDIAARIADHPCYSEEAHHYFARAHVAVAPACNIQCHYCNRKYDCANESRPGVVSERLTPEQAVRKVMAIAAEMPQLSVVGVAGPGDALANADNTFAVFERLRALLPDLKPCLSTNGLLLPQNVERIAAAGVDHVTITINAVDPDIGAQIYAWIGVDGRKWTGRDGAAILLARQLQGLQALVAKGILVKVNSVLIPGINDDHMPAVNAEIRKRGAFIHNIMPLISDASHGTHFGLTGQRGPTHEELELVRSNMPTDVALMRHCRQCRADAVGLLGEDRGAAFTMEHVPEAPVVDDGKRLAYRELVAEEVRERKDARAKAEHGLTTVNAAYDERLLVAVCTRGGGRVNEHFGHATEFQVFEVSADGVRLAGFRRIEPYCQGGDGDDDILEDVIASLEGITTVLCARIGSCPRERLAEAGIRVRDDFAFQYIETSVARVFLEGLEAERERFLSA